MKIELNETERQYLIDSMMFYSTFMQYFCTIYSFVGLL